jgi:hypothetical protein
MRLPTFYCLCANLFVAGVHACITQTADAVLNKCIPFERGVLMLVSHVSPAYMVNMRRQPLLGQSLKTH